jgi:alkylhydroperoxidase/carboxymuconolactone decarboxylase family protein YurZ
MYIFQCKYSDSEDEEEEKEKVGSVSDTPYLAAFLLYGPYGVAKWNLDICELFSVDTQGIDNKNNMKKKEKKQLNNDNDLDLTKNIIGKKTDNSVSDYRYALERNQLDIQSRNQTTMELQQGFEMAEKMFSLGERLNDREMMDENLKSMIAITRKRNLIKEDLSYTTNVKGNIPSSAIIYKKSNALSETNSASSLSNSDRNSSSSSSSSCNSNIDRLYSHDASLSNSDINSSSSSSSNINFDPLYSNDV